jgi:hypothetical protein
MEPMAMPDQLMRGSLVATFTRPAAVWLSAVLLASGLSGCAPWNQRVSTRLASQVYQSGRGHRAMKPCAHCPDPCYHPTSWYPLEPGCPQGGTCLEAVAAPAEALPATEGLPYMLEEPAPPEGLPYLLEEPTPRPEAPSRLPVGPAKPYVPAPQPPTSELPAIAPEPGRVPSDLLETIPEPPRVTPEPRVIPAPQGGEPPREAPAAEGQPLSRSQRQPSVGPLDSAETVPPTVGHDALN